MGEVYKARDTRLNRLVAVKVLPINANLDSSSQRRFEIEARAVSALNHSNICVLYDIGVQDEIEYLVMEFIEGDSLAELLTRDKLEATAATKIATQIASAIESAHDRGIIHRDLKPGNVMITSDGVSKVLDFGLAKLIQGALVGSEFSDQTANLSATRAGQLLGTVPYMSPEQLRGKPVDFRIDIWAFGCLLFEMLSGQPPFKSESSPDLIVEILEREPVWTSLPTSAPGALRDLVKRCLKKSTDDRPSSMREIRMSLENIASNTASIAPSLENSVAVLPFENLGDASYEYFADGITVEITNVLSQLPGLRVSARASSFAFKGKREDLRTVAEKLEVQTVLEGTVQRAGNRLRITAQLVNARDGYQLWTERFDLEMTDIFEIQDRIASAIVSRLRTSMDSDAEKAAGVRKTRSIEAFELFLRGRALMEKRGPYMLEAIPFFERAIALDANYVDPMVWLADTYRNLATYGQAPAAVAMTKAKELVTHALQLNPEHSEAWATLACVQEQFEWDFTGAYATMERALAIDPRNSRARSQRTTWSYSSGLFTIEKSLSESERALHEDPLNGWISTQHSIVLGHAGRNRESIEFAEKAVTQVPTAFFAKWNQIRAYAFDGQYERAVELALPAIKSSGRDPWMLGLTGWIYYKMNRHALARAVYDELAGRSRLEFVAPSYLAIAASSAGLPDDTIRMLERCVEERDPMVLWSRHSPHWELVRQHPRFDEVTRVIWTKPT